MVIATKTAFSASLLDEDERLAVRFVERADEEFLTAFCELLDIQQGRCGEAIIVLPEGPVTLH